MRSARTSAVLLVGTLAVGGAVAPASPAGAAVLPELTAMVLHLPRVDFNYQLVAGDSFRVTFTIDRPAAAGGTLIEMRKFRDSGPIHTLPQRVTVPSGQTTAELIVGSVPVDPATETATHQQVSAHTTDGNLPGNVTLFDSLFVVARPATDPRGNAVTREAETGRLSGTQVIRDDNPYNLASGKAFVRYTAPRGFAEFTFTAGRTGEHWVILRYANDGSTTGRMEVTVNGARRVVTLGAGAGLGWYRLDGFRGVPLSAGANLIRVAPVPGATPVDLDWVQIAQV
ncbi:MAG TPA: hypothetical protein VGX25_25295 [Actinophytocola sp.]|uniref:hypothetical protein n=1 Tax=Actinophytocola sp. TaxID=1872138 RepID=UPI002DDC941F|nr:hypothetical protein [Actinophytocola sp.]HEV2782721.1 hypothetical protein [Actinophytocola sp.]